MGTAKRCHTYRKFGCWASAYKVLVKQRSLVFKSNILSAHFAILLLGLILECLVLMGNLDIISLLVFVLVSLNILVGLRVFARQLIRREANKTR